ncbi:DUF6545 domain-containing protein [Amycolatopsis sp. NPDC054798]
MHLALHRRIIEIRDGHMALREHFDPAAVEAASIVAALAAHRAGRRFSTAEDCSR